MKKRSISLSNAAFAALWSLALPEDEDEEQIIMRLAKPTSGSRPANAGAGFTDKRFNVYFPEGMVIYRSRGGRRHEAKVVGGRWQLDGSSERHDTLGALNATLEVPNESAWVSWFYDDDSGEKQSIMKLRDSNA